MGLLLSGKNPAAYKTAERATFTATAGQTTFTVPVGYNVGDIDVYLNGIRLNDTDDFYATNGTTVVLASGANLGDSLVVVCYYNFLNSSSFTKAETDARYVGIGGTTPMTTYLRTPNYGVSSFSDSATASLEANPGLGEQGVGVKAFGRSVATNGGDILYTSDSRGAGGRHRFGYWNGTSFTNTMTLDTSGRVSTPYQPFIWGYHNGLNVASSTKFSLTVADSQNASISADSFTIPVSGVYEFHLFTTCNTNGTENDVFLYKNGVSINKAKWCAPNSTWVAMHCHWTIKATAGDSYSFWGRGYLYGGEAWTSWHIRYVG